MVKPRSRKKTQTLVIPAALHADFKRLVKLQGSNVGWKAEVIIREWVDREEKFQQSNFK